MANIYYWLRRIRKTRREEELSRERFERYEPSYREALGAVESVCGEDAVDELAEWMLTKTRDENHLPRPSEVRSEARRVCEDRGATVPEGSPIND